MKNFLYTLVLLFSCSIIFAQSFKKIENNEEVSSFVINKELFSDIKISDKFANEEEKKIVAFFKEN